MAQSSGLLPSSSDLLLMTGDNCRPASRYISVGTYWFGS